MLKCILRSRGDWIQLPCPYRNGNEVPGPIKSWNFSNSRAACGYKQPRLLWLLCLHETLHTFRRKGMPLAQPTNLIFRRPVVNLYTASLTFRNRAFRPHTVCFVWIWEQTAIISLTPLTGSFYNRDIVFSARYGLDVRVMYIGPSKPSGHYMYRQFNTQQFCILPTQCIYVFCVDLRTNSDYFPIQH